MESAMLLLLIVLGGVMVYMLFSPSSLIGPWLDRYSKKEKESWSGEDVGESLIHQDDKGVPHTTPVKKKKPKKKRVYKRRKKK